MRRRLRHPESRRGTTVVEVALVLPVFLLFLFAIIEIGHAHMIQNTLRSACRTAARLGSTEGQTTADAENHVKQVLGSIVPDDKLSIYVKDAASLDASGQVPSSPSDLEALPSIDLDTAEPRQLFMIRAKVQYNDVALLPNPLLSGAVLEGQAFMRHE